MKPDIAADFENFRKQEPAPKTYQHTARNAKGYRIGWNEKTKQWDSLPPKK